MTTHGEPATHAIPSELRRPRARGQLSDSQRALVRVGFQTHGRPETRQPGNAGAAPIVIPWSIVNGTRVTYFAQEPGQLEVSATILRPNPNPSIPPVKSGKISFPIVTVGKNTELSLWNLKSELVLMVIVFAVTLATGLPALYFAKATFGSFADYAAILAWAIGIDQGKNLIQMLKSFGTDRRRPRRHNSQRSDAVCLARRRGTRARL